MGLLWFAACHDVIFEDVIFEVTAVDAGTSDYRGVINMMHAIFERISFVRCVFIVPAAFLPGGDPKSFPARIEVITARGERWPVQWSRNAHWGDVVAWRTAAG